jgi:hypothetical protein
MHQKDEWRGARRPSASRSSNDACVTVEPLHLFAISKEEDEGKEEEAEQQG